MYKVKCENPNIIINPNLKESIRRCVHASFLGVVKIISINDINRVSNGENACKVFSVRPPDSFKDMDVNDKYNYASQFFFLTSYGEVIDMFQQVPCRHCDVCRETYVWSLKQRIMFSLQESYNVPIFCTLTYDRRKQPLKGPDVRAVQLFKKRLKSTIDSLGFDSSIIKFVVCSEYGKNDNLHYHLLILGFPSLSKSPVENQTTRFHLLQYCWRQPEYIGKSVNPISFRNYRLKYPVVYRRHRDYDPYMYGYVNVEECKNTSKVIGYITKYMTKNLNNPERLRFLLGYDPVTRSNYKYHPKTDSNGKRYNFLTVSQNLGVDFVKSLKIDANGSVRFTNWLDNTLHTVYLCSFYIKKLFPSFNMLVPFDVRRAYHNALININCLLNSCFLDKDLRCSLLHTSLFIQQNFPYADDIPHEDMHYALYRDEFTNEALRQISEDVSIIYEFCHDVDFNYIQQLVVDRDRFLSSFHREDGSFDLVSYSDHIRKNNKFLQSKQKL